MDFKAKTGFLRGTFRGILALMVVNWSFLFIFWVTFFPPNPMPQHVEMVIGFLSSSAISMVLGFYYSGSHDQNTNVKE